MGSEENDIVDYPSTALVDEVQPFRQIDYLWLFNPYTHFNERKGFILDDSCLSIDDYS